MKIDWPDGTPVDCPICGATVTYGARKRHEEWHESLRRVASTVNMLRPIGGESW